MGSSRWAHEYSMETDNENRSQELQHRHTSAQIWKKINRGDQEVDWEGDSIITEIQQNSGSSDA